MPTSETTSTKRIIAERCFLFSELVSSFPKRKRFAGLRFGFWRNLPRWCRGRCPHRPAGFRPLRRFAPAPLHKGSQGICAVQSLPLRRGGAERSEAERSVGPTESSAPTTHIRGGALCRGGRLCPPSRMHRFYGNLRRIRYFWAGRCGHRPLRKFGKPIQKPKRRLGLRFGEEETALEDKGLCLQRPVPSKPQKTESQTWFVIRKGRNDLRE